MLLGTIIKVLSGTITLSTVSFTTSGLKGRKELTAKIQKYGHIVLAQQDWVCSFMTSSTRQKAIVFMMSGLNLRKSTLLKEIALEI